MASLAFGAPWFLLGLATVAIPVILHLIHRRRARPLPFSTLMFLRRAHANTVRKRRLREWLLLLLRCAILAALAFAFADPRIGLTRAGAAGAALRVAIVIDDSFSMQYRHGNRTSFERARAAAESILAGLPAGSQCAIFFTCGNAEREIARLSPNLLEARRSVSSSQAGAASGAVLPAILRARQALINTEVGYEIYVLTDLQKSAWIADRSDSPIVPSDAPAFGGFLFPPQLAGTNPALRDGRPASEEDIKDLTDLCVTVVDCGASSPENLAVGRLSLRRTQNAALPLELRAAVRNFGKNGAEIPLGLRLGPECRELRAETSLSVPGRGGEEAILAFPSPDAESMVTGAAMLPSDALPLDDARYFAIACALRARVLLVTADDPGQAEAAPFYAHKALTLENSPFDCTTISPEELAQLSPDATDVVAVCGFRGWSGAALEALRRFVSDGKGLIVFAGTPEDAAKNAGPEWLPFRFDAFTELPEGERAAWAHVDLTHPMFEIFSGLSTNDLGQVKARGYWRGAAWISGGASAHRDGVVEEAQVGKETLGRDASPPPLIHGAQRGTGVERTRVLARFGEDAPAVLEGAVGEGRVLLFAAPCLPRWCNLPLRSCFLPILYRAVAYLAESDEAPTDERIVGQPMAFPFLRDAGSVTVTVTTPDGRACPVASEPSDTNNTAVFRDTGAPGLYAVASPVESAGIPAWFAVNVDVRESDLARISMRQLEQLLPKAAIRAEGEREETAGAGRASREGISLWGPMAAFLVAMSLCESLLGSLFTHKRADVVPVRSGKEGA